MLDTALSNKYDNEYQTHKNGLTYRIQLGSSNLSVGADYQIAALNGTQQFQISIFNPAYLSQYSAFIEI